MTNRFFGILRHASLSSGLENVRKVLGRHEIAMVQTTAIDQSAGLVNLTTVLAHSSGEWIASDWPVGPIADIATPHRMGAALTYARRYALFTLVGIAGEDDLDAPDLTTPTQPVPQPSKGGGNGNHRFNGHRHNHTAGPVVRHNGRAHSTPPPRWYLSPDASAHLRDRLLAELNATSSADDAALWAHRSLAEKNKLTIADARQVEETFQAKLASTVMPGPDVAKMTAQSEHLPRSATSKSSPPKNTRIAGIDKSALALPEPRRVRDRDHVRYVATQPCLICARTPSDAHHLRFMQSRAMGRKVSDEFTVPLCRGHHREVHRTGDEAAGGWELELIRLQALGSFG